MNIWDQLVDCICRPPRDVYNPSELLGGTNETFMVRSMEVTRLDFELTNKSGQNLMCSHYLPLDARTSDGQLPVVIYCHCNSGSRRDAEEAVWHLLPCGVGVVAFDFAGSGLSEGRWVTLGAREVEDLACVVQHLRAQGGVSSIGLWGRSMGAVTALLYSHLDPDIAGMVFDSPFSRLTDLMLEIVVSQRLPIPKMMLKLALRLMRSSVKRKAGADINTVSPLDVVGKSLIPAMFGHGEDDSFIDIQHSVKLHAAYNSAAAYSVYKNLVRFKGDHNHPRPAFFYSSVCCFFYQQLKLDQVLIGGNPADKQQLLQCGSLNLSGETADQVDRANGFVNTPWSTENMPHLQDLPPAERQAAAAAAAAALMDGTASSSNSSPRSSNAALSRSCAGTAAAAALDCDGLNSPRAAAPNGRTMAGSAPGSSVLHLAPYGLLSEVSDRRQRPQRIRSNQPPGSSSRSSSSGCARRGSNPDHVVVGADGVNLLDSRLLGDPFSLGSRGRLGAIPSPVSPNCPLRGAAAAAAPSICSSNRIRGSTAEAGATLSPRLTSVMHGQVADGQQSSFCSPTAAAPAAAATSAGLAPALRGSTAAAAAGLQCSSSSSNRDRGSFTGLLVPSTTPASMRQYRQGLGAWALSMEDDETEPDLAAAIAASLQEQQQAQQKQQAGLDGGLLGTAAGGMHSGGLQGLCSPRVPASLKEEEEMLRKAIELSLAETQQQEQQQGEGQLHQQEVLQAQQQQQQQEGEALQLDQNNWQPTEQQEHQAGQLQPLVQFDQQVHLLPQK